MSESSSTYDPEEVEEANLTIEDGHLVMRQPFPSEGRVKIAVSRLSLGFVLEALDAARIKEREEHGMACASLLGAISDLQRKLATLRGSKKRSRKK